MALVPFRGQSTVPAVRAEGEDEDSEMAAGRMSFLEHLEELRRRIIYSLVALLGGFLISFLFIRRIFDFIMEPLYALLPKGGPLANTLVYSEPTEAFVLYLKMALLTGIMIAAPFILYQVWAFVAPGLYAREKKFAIPFIGLGSICFVLGAVFSHYVLFPWTWQFLASFSTDYLAFLPRIEPVFSLYTKMLLGMGLIFQMPTVVFFLARVGVVSARFLVRHFKYAVLVIFVVAALITPTGDPLTQALFAAPMVGLYLISIGIAWLVGRRRPKGEAA
ncbi:MAG: twin-arginine translocase subunit TatC [Vicinamibacterales bacterium]